MAAHNVLLAHAAAVKHYREHFQGAQGGKIGITNNVGWSEPASSSRADISAAERSNQFSLGWFADPIYLGDYPAVMRNLLGDALPRFTNDEKELVKGSTDFFGLNHYGSAWTYFARDAGVDDAFAKNKNDGMLRAQSDWLYGQNTCLSNLCKTKEKYPNNTLIATPLRLIRFSMF